MDGLTTYFHPNKNSKMLHVGIIPDGGRRWAKVNNVPLAEAYSKTRDLLAEFTRYLFSAGVNELSIYLSSVQNFRRTATEIDSFTRVVSDALNNQIINLSKELNVKINIVGNSGSIPNDHLSPFLQTAKKAGPPPTGTINLCVAYNPVDELNNAFKLSGNKGNFLDFLWVKRPLDLIIRGGGANLTSNFLPLQSGFARLYFLDELFNDVKLSSIKEIMGNFTQLNRKFGD
ncbi:MAG: hypothetical protein B6D64_01035 [Bacteroidetes bacterium 4484_276]|nr:MAG: hypothetical protein B6D64_01035 [Bacteroidetes bacterium 4484_276]